MALAQRIAMQDPFALRMAKFSLNQMQDEMGYRSGVTGAFQTLRRQPAPTASKTANRRSRAPTVRGSATRRLATTVERWWVRNSFSLWEKVRDEGHRLRKESGLMQGTSVTHFCNGWA